VSAEDFAATLALAAQAGLRNTGKPLPGRRRGAVLVKEGEPEAPTRG